MVTDPPSILGPELEPIITVSSAVAAETVRHIVVVDLPVDPITSL
jgi:hypothetical protein